MRLSKTAEQNFSTGILRVAKIIGSQPRVVDGNEDLNVTPTDGQFYREKLTDVRITDRTAYKIDKILYKRVRRSIREYLVRWRRRNQDFDYWVPAVSVKNI